MASRQEPKLVAKAEREAEEELKHVDDEYIEEMIEELIYDGSVEITFSSSSSFSPSSSN